MAAVALFLAVLAILRNKELDKEIKDIKKQINNNSK
jgi:hypothetical protein